ncbi:MAG: Holliday junction branch migration protein RuvA [Verrucomicrobia bacterium]|nr:Holliday junction branch migration protein RuvA [Verrucomicrobiota bacterium]
MITSIHGLLTEATPLRAVVELNGFGYEVNIPVTTAEKLPAPGAQVKLHTLVIYREDAQTLYGFSTPAERDFFRLMIETVSGVGPKLALTILSRMSLPLLESAIRNGDVAGLSKCPGIGKKTAERLVIELRAKVGVTGGAGLVPGIGSEPLGSGTGAAPAAAGDVPLRDAVLALGALGYKAADADAAVRRAQIALGAGASTEKLIKHALAG